MAEDQLPYHQQRALRKNGLLPELPTRKEPKPIPKKSPKRKAKEIAEREAGTDNEMDLFFEKMRKKMTGRCLFTGDKSLRDNDEMYKFSIAHLLPKRRVNQGGFPSVRTHEDNWIELSWDKHTDFDNGKISWELIRDSKEWDVIREKLLNVLPCVAPEERKHKLYSKLINLVYGKNNNSNTAI